jgi:hypothetical protein
VTLADIDCVRVGAEGAVGPEGESGPGGAGSVTLVDVSCAEIAEWTVGRGENNTGVSRPVALTDIDCVKDGAGSAVGAVGKSSPGAGRTGTLGGTNCLPGIAWAACAGEAGGEGRESEEGLERSMISAGVSRTVIPGWAESTSCTCRLRSRMASPSCCNRQSEWW